MKTLWSSLLGCADAGGEAAGLASRETAATLMAGGIAGMACWASIYPIDVVKSTVQVILPTAPGVSNEGT